MDKAAKRLAVIYVILLSLCAPLMAVHFELFTWFMGVVDMSYWTQTVLWFLPMLVYGGILVILGIWNMVKSFQIYKRQDILGCINGMLIHKYGLFLADVLDAMYLAAGKWGRGKKSSVLVALVYIAAVVGIVWIVYKLKN